MRAGEAEGLSSDVLSTIDTGNRRGDRPQLVLEPAQPGGADEIDLPDRNWRAWRDWRSH